MDGAGQRGEAQPPPREARARRRRRLVAGASALGAHVLLIAALVNSGPPRLTPLPPPMEVALVTLPPPAPLAPPLPKSPAAEKPRSEAAPAPGPIKPAPKRVEPKRPPPPQKLTHEPPPDIPPRIVPAEETPTPEPEPQVSAAEIASATTAENEAGGEGGAGQGGPGGDGGAGGGGGGRCDMVRRLQTALRHDAQVRAAILSAHRDPGARGKPIVVWNGDWVRRGGEEGKGLAGVRQAIAVEVAFAPKTCRNQSMRGLVLLSLNDAPGGPRVVLGAGAWRWSDLLFVR